MDIPATHVQKRACRFQLQHEKIFARPDRASRLEWNYCDCVWSAEANVCRAVHIPSCSVGVGDGEGGSSGNIDRHWVGANLAHGVDSDRVTRIIGAHRKPTDGCVLDASSNAAAFGDRGIGARLGQIDATKEKLRGREAESAAVIPLARP